MVAVTNMPIQFYAIVGGSQVINHLGSIDLDVELEPLTDENRLPGDAPEAQLRVVGFDLPGALRSFADALEVTLSESRPGPVL